MFASYCSNLHNICHDLKKNRDLTVDSLSMLFRSLMHETPRPADFSLPQTKRPQRGGRAEAVLGLACRSGETARMDNGQHPQPFLCYLLNRRAGTASASIQHSLTLADIFDQPGAAPRAFRPWNRPAICSLCQWPVWICEWPISASTCGRVLDRSIPARPQWSLLISGLVRFVPTR